MVDKSIILVQRKATMMSGRRHGKPKPPKVQIPPADPPVLKEPQHAGQPDEVLPCGLATAPDRKRISVLGFMDSLYAGSIAFAVSSVAPQIDKHGISQVLPFLGRIFPMIVAIVWIADDWICARITLHERGYPENSYRATIRLVIDLVIVGLSFGLVLASIPFRPFWYVTIFALLSILGWAWAKLLKSEINGISAKCNGDVDAILMTHQIPSVVLVCLAVAIAAMLDLSETPAQMAKVHRWTYWVGILFPITIFVWYKVKILSFNKEEGHG